MRVTSSRGNSDVQKKMNMSFGACHSLWRCIIFVLTELPTVKIFPKELPSILEGGKLKLTCLFQKEENANWKKNGATNI